MIIGFSKLYPVMRQFILTILIISNIGTGFEIATDFDDVLAGMDVLTVVDGQQCGLAGSGNMPAEEAVCDHCCHAVAHFAGAVVSCPALPFVRPVPDSVFTVTAYQLAGSSPPTPPPNV